jgi:hypothetical protein
MRKRKTKGYIHPILQKYFETFIPDQSCREYVFERMMMIVDDRLPVILVMNTLTGTGKGLFVEHILRHGVGVSNWVSAPKSWDKSGFNSWMGNKQLVWFDEEKVMPDGKESNTNYLKRLINDYQAIEKKGLDVNDATKVWCSMIITNNQGTKNFRLEEDNRRFSILDVGMEKLRTALGEDEEKRIATAIVNNEDNMLDFFWLWLSENFSTQKHGGLFTLWKGPKYKMFQYESRSPWQKTIIDMCTSGMNSYRIEKDELEAYHRENHGDNGRFKFPYHVSKIENFLKEFTYDNHLLGIIERAREREKRGYHIEIDDHWLDGASKAAKKAGLVPAEASGNSNETVNNIVESKDDDLDFDLGEL